MAKLVCAGPGCRKRFEPRRSTARFCSPSCSQRARRKTRAAKTAAARKPAARKAAAKKTAAPKRKEATQTATSAADNHELVVALRQELETAGALDIFEGQLAIELARRLVKPDSNASSLADKVRAARDAALSQADTGSGNPPGDQAPPENEDDEVTRARTRREEARKAAGIT